MKEPIRTEAQLSDEQRGLLAWTGTVSGDEALDRLKDHIILVADSLRLALRREAQAREMLHAWLTNCGSLNEPLGRDTTRWLEVF